MRHHEYVDQPSYKPQNSANLVGRNLVARDRLLRISEIMTVLGFADTLDQFADRFLGISKFDLDEFLSGDRRELPYSAIERLKWKLDIVHNTVADEIAGSSNKFELWPAQSRYNQVQTAHLHFEELTEKLD